MGGPVPQGQMTGEESNMIDPGVSPAEALQESLQTSTDPEEREGLMAMIEKFRPKL